MRNEAIDALASRVVELLQRADVLEQQLQALVDKYNEQVATIRELQEQQEDSGEEA